MLEPSSERDVAGWQLRTAVTPAGLDHVQDLVQRLWRHHDVEVVDRIRFEAAVAEIAGNVIEHSVPAAPAGVVTMDVTLTCTELALQAVFTDDGRPAEVYLEDVRMPGSAAEGGRGLALAIAVCDVLSYRRDGDLNRWTALCQRS